VRDYDSCLCERTQRGSEPFGGQAPSRELETP
jgi:hypothetical protein